MAIGDLNDLTEESAQSDDNLEITHNTTITSDTSDPETFMTGEFSDTEGVTENIHNNTPANTLEEVTNKHNVTQPITSFKNINTDEKTADCGGIYDRDGQMYATLTTSIPVPQLKTDIKPSYDDDGREIQITFRRCGSLCNVIHHYTT